MKNVRFSPAALIAVLSAAGAVGYVVWGFLPSKSALADLRRQIGEKDITAAEAPRVAQQIAQTTEELNAARSCAAAWSEAAVKQESLITLFRDINQLSQSAGTRNLRLEPAPVETLAAVWRAPVSVSIEGTFPQLFDFVRGVEVLSGGMEFSSLEIKRSSGESETLRMTGTLTIFGAKPDFPVTQILPNSR
jgi:Tfp pilus assembly protein PilO